MSQTGASPNPKKVAKEPSEAVAMEALPEPPLLGNAGASERLIYVETFEI